jgi:hypothetical protein
VQTALVARVEEVDMLQFSLRQMISPGSVSVARAVELIHAAACEPEADGVRTPRCVSPAPSAGSHVATDSQASGSAPASLAGSDAESLPTSHAEMPVRSSPVNVSAPAGGLSPLTGTPDSRADTPALDPASRAATPAPSTVPSDSESEWSDGDADMDSGAWSDIEAPSSPEAPPAMPVCSAHAAHAAHAAHPAPTALLALAENAHTIALDGEAESDWDFFFPPGAGPAR